MTTAVAAPDMNKNDNFNRQNHIMCTSVKSFPEKLHQILEYAVANGLDDVIGFFPHGRAFKVHKVRSIDARACVRVCVNNLHPTLSCIPAVRRD